ncbi:hypothetical protein P7C71_g3650, partial [Lecanoromycetidae sp. Uapishka_2]
MPVRLGIIGLSADKSAWATRAHVDPLKSDLLKEKYQITAVATSKPETAEAAAKAYGISKDKGYSSPEAIAKDPDVDMVVVSVKTPLHKQLAIPALEAKKDVFVEWPLGNGLQEAEELAALAKKQGVKTLIGLQSRLAPSIRKAKELIDSGALGRITTTNIVTSNSMFNTISARSLYMNDPRNGANLVSIAAGHTLDALCYLLGEFKHLNATTAVTFPEIALIGDDGKSTMIERKFVDAIAVQGILENGATANYVSTTTTTATPTKFEWIISGEKGSLKFEGGAFIALFPPKLYEYKAGEGAKWEEVDIPGQLAFGGVGELYAAYAKGEKDGLVDFDEAVKRHRMVDAIYRSAEKGTRETY